jgi:two-component system, NtrC family, sensor histidine kinase KinB
MKMKIKLMLGLGFLFAMIFGITIFCTYYIQKLADDSNNILKDNYKSLEYSKKLLTILDDIDNNLTKSIFLKENKQFNATTMAKNINNQEQNFNKIVIAEEKNITEEKEKEFVDTLKQTFSNYSSMINTKILISYNSDMYNDYISSYKSLKKSIDKIYQVNANAIIRKNQIAKDHSNSFIRNMAIFGAIFIILGFAYFWYYPFYVSHSLSIISAKSEKLLKDLSIDNKLNSKDEFIIIQNSLNLLEENIKITKNYES